MRNRAMNVIVAAVLACLIPGAAQAQLTPYSQDFETLDQASLTALSDDGWLVFGSVFDAVEDTFLYGYGAFPAPNDGAAFSQIDLLQGGVDQGLQQLVVFSDYNNVDHANGYLIESNVFQEQIITSDDVGDTWEFFFESKLGNIELQSTAAAFIKTIDPNNAFAQTNLITEDMTATPVTWTGYTLTITIDSGLVGQYLQFGFKNTATLYQGSGIFYDNIDFRLGDPVGNPPASAVAGALLKQNYPNPFNPRTQIDFVLERSGTVEIAVYNLAGRQVATLERSDLEAGEHSVVWDGRSDDGSPVASGQYQYVLKTASGKVSRSMVLLK